MGFKIEGRIINGDSKIVHKFTGNLSKGVKFENGTEPLSPIPFSKLDYQYTENVLADPLV
jgi:hypothetical protein